jgi:predicted MFS family arabinose efflux permease
LANERATLGVAMALALAAAASLGLARFSYALLLPPMRAELGWNYFVAGAMNTANAAGYFIGALLTPRWFARIEARRVVVLGGVGTALALAAHALAFNDTSLYVLRVLAGVGSAATFVGGGLLAARLAHSAQRPGLVLGLYYGGAGVGIIASALLVPPLDWRAAWIALAIAAALCTTVVAAAARRVDAKPAPRSSQSRTRWLALAPALVSYLMFGLGYIGYMTFIVTLLREQGVSAPLVIGFYILLGAGVIASSWLWARTIERARGGGAMALLNTLLAAATVLPVLSTHAVAVTISGVLFGCVLLSVVASTTALVRHNLPSAAWAAGISAFTIVFAAGQIVGPSLIGWVSDGAGGLPRGFLWSAGFLGLAAVLASGQRPLRDSPD